MRWLAAIWLLLFGVWPLADPGHNVGAGDPMVGLDLALHVAGYLWLRALRRAAMSPPSRTLDER